MLVLLNWILFFIGAAVFVRLESDNEIAGRDAAERELDIAGAEMAALLGKGPAFFRGGPWVTALYLC